jgi:CdiI N-terminal domain
MTVLGDHRDRSEAPLEFWREPDYEAQWREGVERIADGAEASCLVTVMNEPGAGRRAQFSALYRFDEEVAVHEILWLPDRGSLDPEAIYESVPRYCADFETETAEQMPVSEWRLPQSALRDWLRA